MRIPSGAGSAHGGWTNPADEASAAVRDDHRFHIGQVFEDFQSNGGVSSHHVRITECVNEESIEAGVLSRAKRIEPNIV